MNDIKTEIESLKDEGFDNQQIYKILVYRQMKEQKIRRLQRLRPVRILFMS